MGLDSKESHRDTAIRACRTAEFAAAGRGEMIHGCLSSISPTPLSTILCHTSSIVNKSNESRNLYLLSSVLLLGTVGSLADEKEVSKLNDQCAHCSVAAR
jgi:hypothetical protein